MDPDVAELVRATRLLDAASLAETRGALPLASELFERACDFHRAARCALAAGDAGRALLVAVVGRDEDTASEAMAVLAKDVEAAKGVADALGRRGDHVHSAALFETVGATLPAAQAWERGGDAVRAARLFEASGDPVSAAKALEAAIRREPNAWANQLALGELLLRYGKNEAAVRSLQRIPAQAPERRDGLTALVRALGALGLTQAEDEARRELTVLGGPRPARAVAAPLAEPKRRLYGRYDVLREVASTATARVLECVDTVRGEHVAVKVFAGWEARGTGRDILARFEREVRALAAIDHPNVVPLRDFVPDGPAIILDWMGGGTLETMMHSPIAPARAVEIAQAVLSALGEAHRMGVLHRDVKPSNVLFDAAGVARLADFGVAHLGDASATATAGVIGTLAYMSPEQREGRPATIQSDLYGVGAILFEMLTAERLPAGDEPRTRPSGVHRELDARHDAVVLRLVATAPSDRPPDAFAARKELGALSWPRTVEPAALPARAARSPSEHPGADRLEPLGDDTARDRFTGRVLRSLRYEPRAVARAGAFARAAHPALQTVLRADKNEGALWLDLPPGRSLDRPLTPDEGAQLAQALEALHAQGVAHGHVDRQHVLVADHGGALLLFDAEGDRFATADTDRAELARLLA